MKHKSVKARRKQPPEVLQRFVAGEWMQPGGPDLSEPGEFRRWVDAWRHERLVWARERGYWRPGPMGHLGMLRANVDAITWESEADVGVKRWPRPTDDGRRPRGWRWQP